MDPVTIFLVMIMGLFLLGALGEIIFAKTQIPDVVWLIAAGIILGPVTGVVPREMLDTISPFFAAITLIIVLFEGGSRLILKDLMKAAPRASLLAILSFILTVSVVAGLSMAFGALGVLPEWSAAKGIMLGAIVGGSSSLIIMPSMTLAKVREDVANLVSLESALTDALCVVVALAMVDVIVGGGGSAGDTAVVLLKNFGIALLIGIVAGWVWMPVLRLLAGNPHAYPTTLAALIALYVLVDAAGGSAAMGILAFAVMVGNAEAIMKRVGFSVGDKPLEIDFSVRTVHSQMSFIIKSFFFTFIGMMMSPPWGTLLLGVFFGVVLLGSRIPAVWIATRGTAFTPGQLKLITISLPRGMAAGVLATIPAHSGVSGTDDLPSMVFSCVLTSILIFAGLFPVVKKQADGPAPTEMPVPLPSDGGELPTNSGLLPVATGSGETEPPPEAAPANPPAGAPPGAQPPGLIAPEPDAPVPTDRGGTEPQPAASATPPPAPTAPPPPPGAAPPPPPSGDPEA